MVLYEVNLSVDDEIANEYSAWLREHIREMLEIDGFETAAWYEREPDEVDNRRNWTIHYHVTSQDLLDDYFENDADRMREAGLDRFHERFSADRRVLKQTKVFSQ